MTNNEDSKETAAAVAARLTAVASVLENHCRSVPENIDKAIKFSLGFAARGGSKEDLDAIVEAGRRFTELLPPRNNVIPLSGHRLR
jgi:hypothetical protein